MPNWDSSTEFVYGTDLSNRLDYMTKATEDDIKVVGPNCYVLDSLEAAASRGINYHRALTAEQHIPDRLTEHIKNAAEWSNFSLYQTPVACQPVIISDSEVMLLLPGPNGAAGIHLTGDDHQGHFSNYFQSIITDNRAQSITDDYRR